MLLFTVTFLVMGVLTGLEAVFWRARAVVSALLRDGGPDTYGGRDGRRGGVGRIGVLTLGPGLFE